ncbi:MAG: hypothetical protein EZS28_009063 [Streblomastix strix]|uniref:Right handed beta helix domain-containing protein n=1 Tax=Streblomastix strix TaxID=222440 RepID=A0A5J4WK32_9EUKA|nr:MAG: hypothetical protein EZS28_009063 [Streblomastix strix]
MIFALLLLVLLTLNFRCQTAQNYYPKSESNEATNYYVDKKGSDTYYCGEYQQFPCLRLDIILEKIQYSENYVHVNEGTYYLPLSILAYYLESIYPTIDIIAEQKAQFNITGQQSPIGKIQLSFLNFSIDLGDLFFQIDDDKSSLKFSNCNLFRNAGITAINSHSLGVVNRGSFIMEKLDIIGQSLEGKEPLVYSISPKLIQFTSLTVSNIALVYGSTAPLLLSVNELTQESNIMIYDVHVKQNTAGAYAQAGIIFIHAIEDQDDDSITNEDPSAEPIILIENSEIIQNTLATVSQTCAIQFEGLNPQQILIKNSTIINRSPPNINNASEMKIILSSGSISQDLIKQFSVVYFGPTFSPVAVKVHPNEQFTALEIPLSVEYANIRASSNGQETCTSYIANYYNDVSTLSCVIIIIREQDALGLLKEIPRSISISGLFTENDLRTDGLNVSFTGENKYPHANSILFQPILTISSNPIDSSLFRINDGGQVTLNNLFIQRSNLIGSENAPIVMIISGTEQQMNEIRKNSVGKLIIDKCILEGGNSAKSDVWYNLGLAETCNVGYGAAIVADGQSVVQISGSTIRTFEGPAVRALNGAIIIIERNTILDNNGQRNRNTLSSMQTNVVCEGGIGTTKIDVALDNVTSFTSTGNAWIFSPSDNTCNINATFNGEVALPRSIQQIDKVNVTVYNTIQQDKITVNGKFFEPCMRRFVLEIHEKNKADEGVKQEFGVENSSASVNWINSENIIFQIPQYLLNNLNTSAEWEISIYQLGERESASWISTHPTEINKSGSKIDTILIVSIVVPIIAVIIVIIIIIIIIAIYVRHKNRKELSQSNNNERGIKIEDIEVRSLNEDDKDEKEEQTNQKIKIQRNIPETDATFFTDSDTKQRVSSDNSVSRDYKPDQKQGQSKSQERQGDVRLKSAPQDSHGSKYHSPKRSDSNQIKKYQKIMKDEMNKKTKKQRHQSKDTRKSSKQRKERNNKSKNRQNKEKRRKSRKTSKEKQRSESPSSDLSLSTTSSSETSDTKDSSQPGEYQEEEQSNIQTDNSTTSDEQTSSSSSSSSSSQSTSSSFSNSNENKENKRKQTTEKQKKKKQAKQATQEDSSDSSSDSQIQNKYNEKSKVKPLDSNPTSKVKNNKQRSEPSAPSIQGLLVFAEISNNGEMKYQPQDAEEKMKSKQSEIKQIDNTSEQKKTKTKQIKKNKSKRSDEKQLDNKEPENTKKEDIVVTLSSNANLQSNEKNKELTSESEPPSTENENAIRFGALNFPENYL